jgi:hypothetical protein
MKWGQIRATQSMAGGACHVTCGCLLALQLWDFGSGRLLTNLPFYQPQQDACMLYAARFGPSGCAAEGLLAAGGSGKQPVLRLYNKVRRLHGCACVRRWSRVAWMRAILLWCVALCCMSFTLLC